MQERWNLQFDEEQLEKLIGISFVKDGREIPEELEEVSVNVPESEESAEGSGDDQKLQFWTAFVNYANEHGRSSDIAKQKAAGRTYYDVHIGANPKDRTIKKTEYLLEFENEAMHMFQALLGVSEYLYRLRELSLMYDGKIPLMVQERANWPKKIGRNDPCPCGSGKKYKFCHGKN